MSPSSASAERPPAALLLPAKLRPFVRARRTVPRRALVERLHAKRNVPILLVAAPAGYGKTTVVAELVSTDRRRSAWYSVDELDNEPMVFATHLAEALRELGGDPEGYISPAVDGSGLELSPAFVLAFAALPDPALLVIDNIQHLGDRIAQETLLGLCDAVPSGSQLVLITRSCTYDWLGKVDRKRLLIVDERDLRLSDREAQALLAQARMGLGAAEAGQLNRRCEGWVAGLSLMLAVIGDEGVHPGADSSFGADRFLKEYFEVEVLDQLSAKDREFLLRASLLRGLDIDLCNSALGISNAGKRLEALARQGAFLQRVETESGQQFRLHPLFSEMLDAEIRESGLDDATEVLQRATDWYEEHGQLEVAIECAIRSGDLERTARLASTVGLTAFRSGRIDAVERWLAAVDDPDLLAAVPALAGLGATMLALIGRPEAASRWLRHALAADPKLKMPDGAPAGIWAAGMKGVFCHDGVGLMRADADYARRELPEGSMLRPGMNLAAAVGELLTGDIDMARDSFTATIAVAEKGGSTIVSALASSWLALIHLRNAEIAAAEAHAHKAVQTIEDAGISAYAGNALVYAVSARVALEAGRRSTAVAHADEADRLVSGLTYALPWLSLTARIALAHVRLAFAEPGRAHTLLREIEDILSEQADMGELVDEADALRRELKLGRAPQVGWQSALTPAELRLLPLLAGHHSFREIAEQLGISRNTVKTQAIAVYRKLEVSSRSGAVERATELGLVAPPSIDLPPPQ